MNLIDFLRRGVEQYLRELPDDEFDELVQRTRPPAGKPADSDPAGFAKTLFGGGDD